MTVGRRESSSTHQFTPETDMAWVKLGAWSFTRVYHMGSMDPGTGHIPLFSCLYLKKRESGRLNGLGAQVQDIDLAKGALRSPAARTATLDD